jgi:hypothetical protein
VQVVSLYLTKLQNRLGLCAEITEKKEMSFGEVAVFLTIITLGAFYEQK